MMHMFIFVWPSSAVCHTYRTTFQVADLNCNPLMRNTAPLGWKVWRQIGQGKPYGRLYRTRDAAEVAKARWVTKYARYAEDTAICLTPIYPAVRPAKPRHSLQRHNPDQRRLALVVRRGRDGDGDDIGFGPLER